MKETNTAPRGQGTGGLIAIMAGVVLGGLVGAFYGETMWLASGGPARDIEKLQQTVAQKEQLAEAAARQGDRDEARRLRGHVPVIERRIAELQRRQQAVAGEDLALAGAAARLVRFAGDIFLRMLVLIVIPLVFTSMVCGITSLGNISQLGRIGGWTLFYYMATGAAAVLLGIILVQTIQPGMGSDDTFAYLAEDFLQGRETSVIDTLLQVVRGTPGDPGSGMIPANIFQAAADTNVLALILFAMVFGGALSALGERGKPAVDFFVAANEAVMKIVRMIIWFAPVGIFGLIASNIADRGGMSAFYEELQRLGWFVATVLTGLAIHAVVLSLVLSIFARRNPLTYLLDLARALLTAMSTDSSSATLPVTMECVEQSEISDRAAGFVLPLGATINMDGTALYEAVAAIFIAQSAGVPLGGAELVIIFLTATLAAVGAPGIPNAGLVTLLIVLSAVNLPATGIGTILAIDWFLDRGRTTVNVYGDAVGAAVIDRHLIRSVR
jgi:Na+/H+-dicarboxylate symporter